LTTPKARRHETERPVTAENFSGLTLRFCPFVSAFFLKDPFPLVLLLIVMSNPTVVFDPYAAAVDRDIVQTILDNYNIASTAQAEWYPVAFFLRDENSEILGGLLGDIWAAWLHVRTLTVAAPVRGRGFGRELIKRAETYAVKRGCTDAYLDTFSFQARPFYEKLGYRVFGTLENHPVGHQHYFMTKKLDPAEWRSPIRRSMGGDA
jgi:GNAT superfamily N-acetyltransferase